MEEIQVNLAFSDTGLDKITKDVASVKKEIEGVGKGATNGLDSINKSVGGVTSSFGSLSSVLKVAGGAFAGLQLGDLALQAVKAAEKLKQLQNTLKRVSGGDADIAAQKFRELAAISNELGLKNGDLVETYSKLALRGFKPTGDEMKKLIDIAKASNKSVDQLAEALLDA